MADLAPPRLFAVSVADREQVVSARSRSAALYQVFLDYSDLWPDCSFRAFLRLAVSRAFKGSVVDDGYAYVRTAYGVDPHIGQRIRVKGETAGLNGCEGIVLYPGKSSTPYVHVALDGWECNSRLHPDSVEFLPMEAAHG